MSVRGIVTCEGMARGGRGGRARRWWRSWRERFGLAEACGTAGAAAGFGAGYAGGSVLAAAGVATIGEGIGFYACVGAAAALAARRATAGLAGRRRLAAAVWHAVLGQLASCAVAEGLDFWLIRPGSMAAGAWLLRALPGGVWLGFGAGKAVADVIWYGVEAAVRRGLAGAAAARPAAAPQAAGLDRVA